MMFEEYRDRVGELITGIVQQSDSRYTLVQLRERVEALLPKSEQVDGERYDHGQRIKAVIKEVSPSTKGPSIIVSPPRPRADQEALRARGPRDRRRPGRDRQRRPRARLPLEDRRRSPTPTASTRSAPASARAARASAWSSPSCAARRSTSSPTTTSPPGSSPRRCRRPACARCSSTTSPSQATVIVPDDQLSLAIGREGQNARLAARLTGWRIDIKSETEFAADGDRLRGVRGGDRRPLRRPILGPRSPLPQRGAAGLAVLRPAQAPGALALHHRRGRDPRAAQRRGDHRPGRPGQDVGRRRRHRHPGRRALR